jgi:hypothetical protein
MPRPRRSFAASLAIVVLSSCGGGGGGSTSPPVPPATIQALSPTTVGWNSAAFTLTVTGSGFSPDAVVQWSGSPRPTSYVSSEQLTAKIAATDTLQSGTDSITVTGSSGGTSNAVSFSIPCVLASPGTAFAQTTVRLGAIYFDGWAGPLDSYHLKFLVNTPYQNREPLSGWRDDNSCAVEQQLAWAHSFGLNFFLFDWYLNAAVNDAQGNENLNSALQITHKLPNRHGIQQTGIPPLPSGSGI